MNKLMWILGATCLGVAAYVLLVDAAGRNPYTDTDLETDIGNWGTKNRIFGSGGILGGKVEQGLGQLADDPAVEGKGYLDEATGRVKDAAGQAAHAVSDTIHDMNT